MAGRASFQGVLRVNGYFMFNEVDKALDCLEQLVESNDPSAHYIRVQLRHYCPQEIIDEVESHPRYRQLLTRLQVHDSWQEELVQKANDIVDITGIQVNRPKAW